MSMEEKEEETVRNLIAIPEDEYDSLLLRAAWADALDAAGVDSWEGFDYAKELYSQGLTESIDNERENDG